MFDSEHTDSDTWSSQEEGGRGDGGLGIHSTFRHPQESEETIRYVDV